MCNLYLLITLFFIILNFDEKNFIKMNELEKCPFQCKCLIEMKESIQKNNLLSTTEMMNENNFRVKTICHKRQIKNMLVTKNMSTYSVQISLQRNFIKTIPSYSFENMTQLYKLNLSYNFIKYIEDNSFEPLSLLKKLDLTGNQLTHLTPNVFNGLFSLSHLILKGNHLTTLFANTLKNSHNSLELLDLENNPIRCYCDITWLIKLKERFKITQGSTCDAPTKFFGISLNSIPIDEVYCDILSVKINNEFINETSVK